MRQKISRCNFLLLGGEGFIGRNLAQYLSAENTCLSVGSEKSRFEQRRDNFLLAKPYEQKIAHKCSVIVHLIDNKVAIDSFVEQEKKLVENIGLNKNCHLVVFSSAVMYVNPQSEYGQRKQLLESFYIEYCKNHSIPLTILRLFNTFGPYQIPYKQGSLVGNLIYDALNGRVTEINDKDAMRDFLYVEDIPKFIEFVVIHKIEGIHDVGTGSYFSIQELISLIEKKVLNRTLDISYKGIKEVFPIRCAESDIAETIDLVKFEDGLRRTVEFYENNMPILKSYVE